MQGTTTESVFFDGPACVDGKGSFEVVRVIVNPLTKRVPALGARCHRCGGWVALKADPFSLPDCYGAWIAKPNKSRLIEALAELGGQYGIDSTLSEFANSLREMDN